MEVWARDGGRGAADTKGPLREGVEFLMHGVAGSQWWGGPLGGFPWWDGGGTGQEAFKSMYLFKSN